MCAIALFGGVWSEALIAQLQTPPPLGVTRSIVEEATLPSWLRLPPARQLELPLNAELDIVDTAVVSHDARREAAIVGLLRNVGRSLRGVRIRVQYLDANDQLLLSGADAESLAEVARGDVFPFKVSLPATIPTAATVLRLSVDDGVVADRQTILASVEPGYVIRRTSQGLRVSGHVQLMSTGDDQARAALWLTVALLDREGAVVDVLSGALQPIAAPRYSFDLRGTMPVHGKANALRVWVESRH